MLNNKGQIAEGITWVVATVIIIVTLVVFVFISVNLAKAKNLTSSDTFEAISDFWVNEGPLADRFKTKTIFALSLKDSNKEVINNWIKNEEQ